MEGVHFWRLYGASEARWEHGDGTRAERFLRMRVGVAESGLFAEAVREQRIVFSNQVPAGSAEAEFGSRGVLVAPVIVSGEVTAVLTFLHDSENALFQEDFAAKAKLLAADLGKLLEAAPPAQKAGEDHRRAEILADVAQVLHGTPDVASVVEALADRLRLLLRTHLVCVLLKRDGPFELRAVSAETPQLANSVRARHDRQTLRFASELAQRAVAAGEVITLSIADAHSLGNLVSPGTLIAAPLRTSRTQGAILVYPRREGIFTAEEKSLVSAIASFGAVAIAHAELYSTAHAQAHELHQLLEISSQLSSSGDLNQFLQAFVIHAADFLGFGRSFIALLEDDRFLIRYGAESGRPTPVETVFPEGIATRALRAKEVFRTDEASRTPGTNLEVVAQYNVHQFLAVPLLGADGQLLGMFGVLDKLDGTGILQEDVRRSRALSNQAAVALEVARNLHSSEQHRQRVEQANRHWMEIFDAIPDLVVVHDQDGKVLRVNRSLAAMIGAPPAELIGLNIRALLSGSDMAHYSCPFCRPMAEERDEFVHSVFDRAFLISTSRVHADSDEGLQTIHILKDITDRREAERRYRELFDNIQEGLFFSTPGGRFIEVNDAMVRMLGYESREELLQIDIPTQLYFSPQERQCYVEAIQEKGSMHNFEATLRRKDGSPIHVLINSFALYDDASQIVQIRGLMLDVTGLRTYQSELHRERDFSAKILDNTQSLIVVADTAGLVSYANRRWQEAGLQEFELLGRPLLGLVAPAYTLAFQEALRSTLKGQQVDNLEVQIVCGGGLTGKFSANLSPMRDEHGVVSCIVAVLTDITDSAVLRDKLVHAEKMAAVGQLVSGVAHEVNNPLTAILGFADLLMENAEVPESARKDLRVILQEAQRTKQIVQNLLSFARQMPPQRAEVQLNSILRRTVQLRSYDFTSHGVDVVEHLDENLPEVMGDAHQLQQVFLNILNNAYDAVHEVGRHARIEIMSTKAGDAVEVSFRDNGNGISYPDKIFDPFFTTKEVGKGTGLGLSICYGIVKEHGGEILCQNNLGEPGATFIVRLPAISHTASFRVAAGVKQT
ncbi:MAG TPA: PAS domain S-box protein [Candidatus Aquilonibacter sp.]|nr:PAS domain S-box protein [Candidatus Aquilonibacter sp.]